MFSSYFFFGKMNGIEEDRKLRLLGKYVTRNIELYFSYFVILLPFTLYYRRYWEAGIKEGMIEIFKGLIFGSTFRASWYLMASIIGISILFWVEKKPQKW